MNTETSMRDNKKKLKAKFGPEIRFEFGPIPRTASARAEESSRFEALKRQLLNERLSDIWETEVNNSVRRAANDAASLAWTTPYPLLTFPELFEEMLRTCLAHVERQTEIFRRSRVLLAA